VLCPRSTSSKSRKLLATDSGNCFAIQLLASKSMGKNFWIAFTSHGCGLQSSVALQLRTSVTPFSTANKYKYFMVLVPIWKSILSNCYSDKTFWSGTVCHSIFSPIQYTVLVHSTVDMGNFYTSLFFSPPCRVLCRSIVNEQSLFNRLHFSYSLST
jgi:hypothetical protein